ncbi:hypothetical protein ES332_A02G050500v1 [Gossypium tomentosum]|uniref:Cyanate lyase C-terminal domain-containing protein n=1 Tax=Gossypium tomentosum TaxID=34277 RepID=A0A5D2RFU7_GOSTO|nr:hypothetical protein ES332_A02G050500v1 [Gossypium tomentosum]
MSTQLRLAFMFQMAEETGLTNGLDEAVMHYGESINEITNEEFGNCIISPTVFYRSADKVKGGDGEDRFVVTFDGKYLPYTEQKSEHMASKSTTTSKLTNS